VITLAGAVLRVADVASAPYGASSGP
jgi:hypothetical protein